MSDESPLPSDDVRSADSKMPFDDEELQIGPADFSPDSQQADSERADSHKVESPQDVPRAQSEHESASTQVIRVRSGSAARAERAERVAAQKAQRGQTEPFTLRSRRGVALATAVALIALAGAGTLLNRGHDVTPPVPTVEPVASSELVCPITTATSDLTSVVTAGVAPVTTAVDGTASLANLVKAGAATDPLVIKSPGSLVSRVIEGKSAPAQVASAIGSFATGFGADQSMRSGVGSSRGLAIAPCGRPLTDGWLIGGESSLGRLTTILLVNNDDRPAQVDLDIYGAHGPIVSPAASGIAVAAASTDRISLATLAPNEPVTAVHVLVQSGRVGASALEFDSRGLIPQGVSIISPSTSGRSLVIPMVPKNVTGARLILLAPTKDATAHVTLLTPQGPITPVGFDSVDLAAGEVANLDLTPVLVNAEGGLVIKADHDIVAGVLVTTGSRVQLQEGDRESATPALTSPGLITGLAGGNLIQSLGIASPTAASTVKIDLYASGSSTPNWTSEVKVRAGSIADVRIPVNSAEATSMALVTPVSGGPVYVTRVETEIGKNGPMVGLAPLLPTRASTVVPPVEAVPGSAVLN
jgi:hypothetical protein